ncbi:MAG: hypothetical protein HYV23_06645 [Deltaproteobacteria bacterium]|nr:hypothetical protein [Deltaproteobacteria bacterium]
MKRAAAVFLAVLAPAIAFAYPNGTPDYVTDTGPFCASCHSVASAEYMAELPADRAKGEVAEIKHYGLVRMPTPPSPYIELANEEKEELIRKAKLIDASSSVTLEAPKRMKAGQEASITVKARGGNGPAICVMLVDRASRFQARPVSSMGWLIQGAPEVRGQDGKPQTGWLDKRASGTGRNLNYITIADQRFDLEKKLFPEGTVTYRVKAPSAPGVYTMAAAFLYGTENAVNSAFFQRPSGRILFSGEVRIEVE